MATVIRLQRGGRKKRPFYSVVVTDERKRRDGAFIEKLGYFDPCKHPEIIEIDAERAKHWLAQGAKPSDRVATLLGALEEGSKYAEKAQKKVDRKANAKAEAEAKAAAEAAAAAKAAEEAEAAAKAEEEAAAAAEAAEEAPAEEAAPEAEAEEKTDA